MAEFVFEGPNTYACSDAEILDACLRVRNRYSILHNLIFEAFKSGVPAKEIHLRVSEPSTWKRKGTLHIDRLLDIDMLGRCLNIEELFEEVFKDMVDRIYEERKKRDMDVTINPNVIKSSRDATEVLQEKIQKIVEDYIKVLNEEHEDMGEFYYEHRKGDKYMHMLHCRAKDFKWGSFGTSFSASAFVEQYTRNEMDIAVSNIQEQIIEHHARIASGKSNYWKVIFNPPATIVLWGDGSKTVVKCGKNEKFDPEKGLAMCIAKKVLGNKGNYYELFKEWLPPFFVRADGYVDCPVIISKEAGGLEE